MNYTLKSKLGEGGMATVYLADDHKFHTEVALKMLKKEFVSNENIKKRFLAEARSMFRMSHPHVIRVSDLIDEEDTVAFVMEYVEGETLKEYVDSKGRLTDAEIKDVFSQMLDAVGYVHEQKLVHRDIKPSNFMIDKSGKVKLMDFGIAKTLDTTAAEYTLTGTGMQLGTPMYMSPEQITETKSVTAQSDIYSLGVVLWQMVTGKKPYDTKTLSNFQLQTKIVTESLSKTNTSWDRVIQQATAKECENRYKSCIGLKQDLATPITSKLEDSDTTQIDIKKAELVNESNQNGIPEIISKAITEKPTAIEVEPQKANSNSLIVGGFVILFLILFAFFISNRNDGSTEEYAAADSIAVAADSSAAVPVQVDDEIVSNDLLAGRHKLSLQWISWEYFGFVDFVKTGENLYEISGYQDGKKSNGECDNCYLKINGSIKKITDKQLVFSGRIESSVPYIQNGIPCIKEGTFTFKSTQGRKYWRLQEMNGCDGVTDYVDIYF
jgi:serine/threonine protein kinase